MADSINNGGPAFPQTRQQWQDSYEGGRYVTVDLTGGMTLRDWFAGQCMRDTFAALAAAGWENLNEYQLKKCAEASYKAADAMIAERGK